MRVTRGNICHELRIRWHDSERRFKTPRDEARCHARRYERVSRIIVYVDVTIFVERHAVRSVARAHTRFYRLPREVKSAVLMSHLRAISAFRVML